VRGIKVYKTKIEIWLLTIEPLTRQKLGLPLLRKMVNPDISNPTL
jgi:hypothetical protein